MDKDDNKPPKSLLSEYDKALWQQVTEGDERIESRHHVSALIPSGPKKAPFTPHLPSLHETITSLAKPQQQFHHRVRKQLTKGQITIDARVDLHGMTQEQAWVRLERFIQYAVLRGHRHVLVITGRGKAGRGVLRENFTKIIQQPPFAAAVISYDVAPPNLGGNGAFVLHLRKKS